MNIEWRKSSYTADQGNCVEVVEDWQKSSYSNAQGNCVEAAYGEPGILVRDSKDPDGPVLGFGAAEWQTFTSDVKAGRYGSLT
jgi:Domain of unknown function (DUF397)